MNFEEILDQALAMLQRRRRMTYSTLRLQFQLNDAQLAALKDELLYSQPGVVDDAGRGLVWTGDTDTPPALAPSPPPGPAERPPGQTAPGAPTPVTPRSADAERRQLTVMFCDLVDSTALATQLDPEDLRQVVRAYQAACAEVIQRFAGHIAQYLGDGLLVYFGYPQAHEDDAQRAVHTGLGIVEALATLNSRLAQEHGVCLAVRVGIHTGLVVVGEIGEGGRQEQLALGDTPNIAARLQGLAAPDTVVISTATSRLVQGFFACSDLGSQTLKGVAEPVQVYRVLGQSGVQSRLDLAGPTGLTPLVGREQEVGLLQARWVQTREGRGQAVLLSGEAGIGKSRLVEVLRQRVGRERATRLTFRCSPYHTNSPLYPVIEHMQRLLHWHRDETSEARLAMLEQVLQATRLPLAEAVPLLAALLSLPVPDRYPPLTLSPQRQKQQTQEVLVAWLLAEAAQQPVLAVWEDLHWADPSTLELLGLILDQTPAAPLCTLLTCRPEFAPPWALRSYLTQLTLSRLTHPQVEELVQGLTEGKALPAEVRRQIVAKTDGVPLFVEELTKMVLEAGWLRAGEERYDLTGPLPPLAIPATLQDALRARLDRLAEGKAVAQLGAVLGRTFAYELLRAVAQLDELALWRGLGQLVQAEVLYQRGTPPHATYTFKHALLQDAASQSLLKSTRQHYHQRTAQVVAEQFPDLAETQPELVAQHYTEAGINEQAVDYWRRAGQRASERSANQEAISHLTTGLALLRTLPQTPARTQHELLMQTTLGPALMAIKGQAAPEVEHAYARARDLCQQLGEPPQLFPVLLGLVRFYVVRGVLQTARALGEQLLRLAQRGQDPAQLLAAHQALGATLFWHGEWALAHAHTEQALALYALQPQRGDSFLYGIHPGVNCLLYAAHSRWLLGYPEQACQQYHAALTRAQGLAHAFTLAHALATVTMGHQLRREGRATQELAETLIALGTEQASPLNVAWATILRGWALATQGQTAEAIAQMRHGLVAARATGAEGLVPYFLALLAEACGQAEHTDEGLRLLAEALAVADTNAEHWYEAELYRLKGELLLAQSTHQHTDAEACFQHALNIAGSQHAKSWELRAAMSLSRLWQQQGKRAEARQLLAPLYGWFTEGFDTADLQEARALLEELEREN